MKKLNLKYKVTKIPNGGLKYALVDLDEPITEHVLISGCEYVVKEVSTVLLYHNISSHKYSIVNVLNEDKGKDVKKVQMMPLKVTKNLIEIGLGVGFKSQFFIDIFERAKFLDGRRYLYMKLLELVKTVQEKVEDSDNV